MQPDDFLTGCARTTELSIQGQQLLAQDIACALRHLWGRLAQASGRLFFGHPAR